MVVWRCSRGRAAAGSGDRGPIAGGCAGSGGTAKAAAEVTAELEVEEERGRGRPRNSPTSGGGGGGGGGERGGAVGGAIPAVVWMRGGVPRGGGVDRVGCTGEVDARVTGALADTSLVEVAAIVVVAVVQAMAAPILPPAVAVASGDVAVWRSPRCSGGTREASAAGAAGATGLAGDGCGDGSAATGVRAAVTRNGEAAPGESDAESVDTSVPHVDEMSGGGGCGSGGEEGIASCGGAVATAATRAGELGAGGAAGGAEQGKTARA